MTKQVVIIDKDKVARSPYSEMIQASIDVLIKHGVATTITLDDDIEKRAEEVFSIPSNVDANCTFAKQWKDLQRGYIKGATEQQIISEMKMKEFSEWCSINGWYFYSKDNKWRKHGSGGFEYLSTTELIAKAQAKTY